MGSGVEEAAVWGWKDTDKWQNDPHNVGYGQGTREKLLYFALLACLLPPSNLSISQGLQCLRVRTEEGDQFVSYCHNPDGRR